MPKPASDNSSAGRCSPPECISDRRRTVLRITLAAFAVLLVFSFAAAPASADQRFSSVVTGAGVDGNPFILGSNADDLKNISTAVNNGENIALSNGDNSVPASTAHYKLSADIDLSTVCSATNGSWTPIGTDSKAFKGTFDGGNHNISNLYINSTSDYQGLFGYINGDSAAIKNLGLTNVNVTDTGSGTYRGNQIGGLAGQNHEGKITNCNVTGNVTGNKNIGGLVGCNNNNEKAKIENCSATVAVKGNDGIGGLVGINRGSITNCYATGEVNGTKNVGGLVGWNNRESNSPSTITNCYATGAVTGKGADGYVGGLVGSNEKTIQNCYATGNVTDKQYVGGLAGSNIDSGNIINCYAIGAVTGTGSYVGGLAGSSNAGIKNSTALNQFVNSTGVNVGRVVGYGSCDITCYAWNGMTNSGSPFTSGGNNGTAATSAQVWANITFYQNIWGSNNISNDNTAVWDITYPDDGTSYPLPYLRTLGSENTPRAQVEYLKPVVNQYFSGGDGTSNNPFLISSEQDLQNLSKVVNGAETYSGGNYNEANYTLTCDLILSSVCSAEKGNWTPIGTDSSKFQGTFDGGNHNISDLYINAPNTQFQGLFGYTQNANIKNLGVKDVNVTGLNYVGGLVGRNNGGTITNCYVAGEVKGNKSIGGLAGYNNGGKIENCYATGDVNDKGDQVGGLVGRNNGGTITNCYTTGAVNGNMSVGGLAGYNTGTIENSVALNPSVNATGDNVGRVVGSGGTITNCYAWEGMLVKNALVTGGTSVNENGKSVSVSQIWAFGDNTISDFWGGLGFTNTNWTISSNNKYKLPVLQNIATADTPDASYLIFREGNGGTKPYLIKYAYELKTLSYLTNNSFVDKVNHNSENKKYSALNYTLSVDIDLSTVCSDTLGSWTPIGTSDTLSFQGTFDGGNKTISNLYINTPSVDYQGLFGYTDGATIKNLGVTDVDIIGNQQVGGLVGWNQNGVTITNCYATGTVTGTQNVGGLVGRSIGTITNCFVTVNVTGTDDSVGGLVGWNKDGTITNCYAAGAVKGNAQVGGLVGVNEKGTIEYSVALNPYVNSTSSIVGRVVGNGNCSYCYAWEGMTDGESSSSLLPNGGNNGNAAASAQVWNNTSFYNSTLSWDFSTIWKFNMTNPKYHLPVLQMNPDTTGLDASHLDPSAPININLCTITITNVTYNGSEQSPIVNVSRNGVIFTDANYTVTGNNKTAAGDYKLTITGTGMGIAVGSVIKDWNISKAALSPANFTYTASSNLVYDGTEKTAEVEAKDGIFGIGNISITYHNETTNTAQLPIAVGTYNVNISVTDGTNYTAASDLHASGWNFTIEKRVFSDANITFTIEPDTYVFDGTAKTPALNVTDNYTNLRITEFNASGSTTETAVGTYNVTITGTGNYTADSIEKTWSIIEPVPTPSPTSPSSGGSTDTGSGHFTDYPRTVSDGGHVSFGTSPIVTGVDMPEGVTGNVELITVVVTDTDGREFYATFEINAPKSADGGKSLIYFELDLKKIEADGYTVKDVVLSHKNEDGTWTDLKTTYLGTENGKAKYSAENTVGYSVFAIYYTDGASIENTEPGVTETAATAAQTVEPEPTYVEPESVEPAIPAAVPTAEPTKSPAGLVGLGLGLLGAAAVLRRK